VVLTGLSKTRRIAPAQIKMGRNYFDQFDVPAGAGPTSLWDGIGNFFDQFDEMPAMQLSLPSGVTEITLPGGQNFVPLPPAGTPQDHVARASSLRSDTSAGRGPVSLSQSGGNYFDRFDLESQPPALPAWPDWMTDPQDNVARASIPWSNGVAGLGPMPLSQSGGNFFDQFDDPAPSASVPNNSPRATNYPAPIPIPTPQPASGLDSYRGRGQARWNAARAAAAANPPVPSAVPAPTPAPAATGSSGNPRDMWDSFARGATSEGFYAGTEGASRMIGAGAEGFASQNESTPPDQLQRQRQDLLAQLGNPILSIGMQAGITDQIADIDRVLDARRSGLDAKSTREGWQAVAGNIADTLDRYANNTRGLRQHLRDALPVSPEFAESPAGAVSQGLGQIVGTLPTQVIPGLMPLVTAGQIYQGGYDDAIAHGASAEEANNAAIENLPAAVPSYLMRKFLLSKILQPLVGRVTVGQAAKYIALSAAAGSADMASQQLWANTVARYVARYDSKRPLTQGMVNGIILGAVANAAASGAGIALTHAVSKAQTPRDANRVETRQSGLGPLTLGSGVNKFSTDASGVVKFPAADETPSGVQKLPTLSDPKLREMAAALDAVLDEAYNYSYERGAGAGGPPISHGGWVRSEVSHRAAVRSNAGARGHGGSPEGRVAGEIWDGEGLSGTGKYRSLFTIGTTASSSGESRGAEGRVPAVTEAIHGLARAAEEINQKLALTGNRAITVWQGNFGWLPAGVMMHHDGQIVIQVSPSVLAATHREISSRSGVSEFSARAVADRRMQDIVGEELAHVADMLSEREKWERAGSRGSARTWYANRNRSLLRDLQAMIDRALRKGDTAKANNVGFAILGAYANYYRGDAETFYKGALKMDRGAAVAREFLDNLLSGKIRDTGRNGNPIQSISDHDWLFTAELIRNLVQIDRTGTTTEIGLRAFVQKLSNIMRAMLGRLKGLSQTREIRAVTRRIHEILDIAEGRDRPAEWRRGPSGGLPFLLQSPEGRAKMDGRQASAASDPFLRGMRAALDADAAARQRSSGQ
jgi:hypothetical protein